LAKALQIHEQVGDTRPAFVNGHLCCWAYKPEAIAEVYNDRDPDWVFVTPAQLATLYRQARQKGITR